MGDSPGVLGRVVKIAEGRIFIEAQGKRGSEQVTIRLEIVFRELRGYRKSGMKGRCSQFPSPLMKQIG